MTTLGFGHRGGIETAAGFGVGTWVKVCANTSAEDALLAVRAGADAVGFVFAESSRQVDAAQVAAITRVLPPMVEKIGVFGAVGFEEIVGAVRVGDLTGVQLHGGVEMELVRRLRGRFGKGLKIIQTVHWDAQDADSAGFEAAVAEACGGRLVNALLVDSKVGKASGGTGVSFDWRTVGGMVKRACGEVRVIVAGGLTVENVQLAVSEMGAWGADVASGVESSPGVKDAEKVRAFVRAAKGL